jgi:CheY-like chemotaxis protein/anti-sigma regulatory factor (Ser/Thr protein kinase)
VHSVLDLAKIESGGLRVAPVVLDPASKIAKLAENLQSRAREKGLSFTVELCDPNARVRFDEYCFDAALERVFDNAVKFTEKGSVSIVLERDGEGCLCLEVRDTGLGIAEGYRARLFEPFSQEDDGSDRHFEGSGLGLALAKRYLELNGATISVESVKGRGSVFRIRFSRSSEVSEVETGLGGKAPEGADPTEPATRPAVLVVEDDGDTQHYMRALLKSEYEVLLASSADEARRRLSEDPGRIHIILMDLSLKGPEDGLMLTRELRAQERWKQVSIIATTAHAFADDRRRALDAGCDAYFAKPFDHKALLSLMRELT